MSDFNDLFAHYNKLCGFCDEFFRKVATKHARDMVCRKGCFECCKLETLTAIETFVIARAMTWTKANAHLPSLTRSRETDYCPLLRDGACSVYAHRPVICRTHGLPIILETYTVPDCCPLNFAGTPHEQIDKAAVLDVGKITMNLMRLNLAFCTLLGDSHLAEMRFPLSEVVKNGLPGSIRALIDTASNTAD